MPLLSTQEISKELSLRGSEDVKDYIILLKPRVMSLVVFTALCAIIMAPGSIHPLIGFTSLFCIAVGAGASGCLNMWYDRDIDILMKRTCGRPLPQGRIHPDNALTFGVVLSAASVLVMGIVVNLLAAGLLAFTIGFYVLIYTMWLKRSTPQNIVIGGVAGALPPVIGWACVTNSVPLEAWILFAIIFMWTPPHFWALSLHRHQDYIDAQVPMLPVVSGTHVTKIHILIYSIVMVGISLLPPYFGMNTSFYGLFSFLLGTIFIALAVQVLLAKETKVALKLFFYSIFYLFLLFLAMTLDHALM